MYESDSISQNLLDLLFPTYCQKCNRVFYERAGFLCSKCFQELKVSKLQQCIKCGNLSDNGMTHKICLNKYDPVQFQYSFEYDNAVRKLILVAKTNQCSYKLLNDLIFHEANINIIEKFKPVDLICPIPFYKAFDRRLINHSEYIAKQISKRSGIPYFQLMRKRKPARQQKTLSKHERFKNISSVFVISCDKALLKDLNVLLVDDVSTTGATLLEASKILISHGANSVKCYTLAKEI